MDEAIIRAITDNRAAILWWEFCCLLHDIGKLSDDFLAYRQLWHAMDGGYALRDPHDHQWFQKDKILEREFPALRKFFREAICRPPEGVTGMLRVENAVHNHIDPKCDDLCDLLRSGDGIDSRYDRNNPLPGCEQTSYAHPPRALLSEILPKLPEMYRGNVFGRESLVRRGVLNGAAIDAAQSKDVRLAFLSEGDLDIARRIFYAEMQRLLNLENGGPDRTWPLTDGYKSFRKIRDCMRLAWDPAMSDTTRPDNDTSLWEHVYSVSAIARALLVKRLKLGRTLTQDENKFTIWGFGFDALRYLASADKIGDVVGRRAVIASIFDDAQEFIEYRFPCGNEIYRDENCVFFLITDLPELIEHLQKEIILLCFRQDKVTHAHGELLPYWASKHATTDLTCLPSLIEEIRKGSLTPATAGSIGKRTAVFDAAWDKKSLSICPICRLRPVEGRDKKVCWICRKRRSEAASKRNPEQTEFIGEIADDGRAALIVARFGLRDWLDGTLIRSMFVTEPDGVRRTLQSLDSFRELPLDDELRKWRGRLLQLPPTYETLKNEFAPVAKKDADKSRYAGLIYGRGLQTKSDTELEIREPYAKHGLFEAVDTTLKEIGDPTLLLNAICAKTPTPSTILDVWQTTLQFFEAIAGSDDPARRRGSGWIASSLKKRPRVWFKVRDLPKELHDNETIEVEFDRRLTEVVWRGERFEILGPAPENLENRTFRIPEELPRPEQTHTITESDTTPEAYYPFRLIAATPALLLLLVPASKAVEITREIHRLYLDEFGKVLGRLPLAIGNIFFPSHTPMFSVLDTARRLERGFRRLHEGVWAVTEFKTLPAGRCLGGGAMDFHHPYFRLADGSEPDFETTAGPIVHTSRAVGRSVLIQPNLYKAVWLGSSAARFEADCEASLKPGEGLKNSMSLNDWMARTKGARGDGLPAIPLEQLNQIDTFWTNLRTRGVTDSALRNVATVLATCAEEWKEQDGGIEAARIIALAAAHRFPGSVARQLEEALEDGTFEQMLKLYVHIMKKRLDEKEHHAANAT